MKTLNTTPLSEAERDALRDHWNLIDKGTFVVLVVFLLFGMLSGCGGGDPESDEACRPAPDFMGPVKCPEVSK